MKNLIVEELSDHELAHITNIVWNDGEDVGISLDALMAEQARRLRAVKALLMVLAIALGTSACERQSNKDADEQTTVQVPSTMNFLRAGGDVVENGHNLGGK